MKKIYHVFSFVFPIVILQTVFALHKVYPFGNVQIIGSDFWHQYYPFLSDFWHGVRTGTLSPWSWTAGAGNDYAALFAYYAASPFNLLAVLAPHAWLREMLTFFLLIKIGCAGLFTSFYLRYTFHWEGEHSRKYASMALPFFSGLYALCAFTLGYYWNIIWLDSFALLPLVMLGVLALMRDGKYRLYTISLASAVLVNFYIGFFICIFTVITFFCQSIILKLNLRTFLRKLALIAACSVLALGLAAVVLIPAYSAVQNVYAAERAFPNGLVFYNNIGGVLGNFIAFTPPTIRDGLPNLYSGMISLLLACLFVRSRKISVREKVVFLGTLVFLLLSCNLNFLDYIWNGFRFTNSFPFRYSFLISFVLAAAAYRAWYLMEDINRRDILAMGITAAVFLLAAFIGPQKNIYVIGSAALCVVYLLLLGAFGKIKTAKLQAVFNIVFFSFILAELSISAYIGVRTNEKKTRDEYPDRYSQVQELLSLRQSSGQDFFRTELAPYYSLNDSSLYYYRGISFFSSTANISTTRFMRGLGLPGADRYSNYYYGETSPLTNAFLNIRYLINRDGKGSGDNIYWEQAGTAGDSTLFENKRYLPLGFMVNEDAINYIHTDNNPFLSQNNLFRRTTGLVDNLFTIRNQGEHTYITGEEEGNNSIYLGWRYEVPSDGMLYAYFWRENTPAMVILHNNIARSVETIYPSIFTVGYYLEGDIIFFLTSPAARPAAGEVLGIDEVIERDSRIANAVFQTGTLNAGIFDQGYAMLAAEALQLTHFSETRITGHVTALKGGLLYTSIPFNKNWTAYVNGARSETLKIGGGMLALRLGEGKHNVEFRYRNKSLAAGMVISLVSLIVLAALIGLDVRLKRKNKS